MRPYYTQMPVYLARLVSREGRKTTLPHLLSIVGIYSPRRDVGRRQADKLWVEVGDNLFSACGHNLGTSSYFDASHLARLYYVVHHKSHAPGACGVAELLALAHTMSAYVYGVQL